MGNWQFTNTGRTKILDNTGFDIDSGSYKMALFLSTSNIGAASTTYAGVTNEVANGVGYSTGGQSVSMTLSGTTTVTASMTNTVWTAAGGSITARFAVIYEVAGNVLAYLDFVSDQTATDTNTLTVSSATGVFTLA